MRKFFVGVLLTSLSIPAFAAPAIGSVYGGITLGQTKTDLDDITVYGVNGGYQFTKEVSVEAGFTTGDKTFDDTYMGYNTSTKLKMLGVGVYGAYRYDFGTTPFYAKGKAGLAYSKAEATATVTVDGISASASDNANSTSLSYGAALGVTAINKIDLELGYTVLDSDIDLISLSAAYRF